jgi:PAS domain S-box-containing protein
MNSPLFASTALSNQRIAMDLCAGFTVNQPNVVIRNGEKLTTAPSGTSGLRPEPQQQAALDMDTVDLNGDFTPSSGLSLDRADTEAADSIHRVQVAQTVRAIPLLLLFHAAAAMSLQNLGNFQTSFMLINIWHGFASAVGAAFAVCFFMWRLGHWHQQPEKVLRGLELLSFFLGLVWAVPIATVVELALPASVVPVAGITLAMLGIGVVSLIRVPTGAVVFLALPSNQGMAALLCIIYCLVLVGVTLNSHMDFRRRATAEIEVKRQNDVIRLLLNDFERDARDWLWETDREGRLTYVSPRLAQVLQIEAEALRWRPFRHVLADHTSNEEWRRLEEAMATELPVANLQIELELQGRPVFWQLTAHPLRDRANRHCGYRGVCRDVTATQEAQRRIEAAMEISERASAAKSQFLAVMSHELRTPINAIVGFSELIARDKDGSLPPASRREFAETILESSRHLQALIGDLLDVTRIERGTFKLIEQQVDAAELVEVAIKLCREQAEKIGISIVARLTDGIVLDVDMTRTKQVIINLLTNAIKFSTQGGIVNVEMQRGTSGRFVLAIKDAGIGISEQDIERVFDPFVQADSGLARRYGGVGLGLPIARRIARLHDGDVTLESTEGAGTTASLILPQRRVTWPQVLAPQVKQVA